MLEGGDAHLMNKPVLRITIVDTQKSLRGYFKPFYNKIVRVLGMRNRNMIQGPNLSII